MSTDNSFASLVTKSPHYTPSLIGGLVLLSLLLFVDKLSAVSPAVQQWLIPSLAAYVLTSCLISQWIWRERARYGDYYSKDRGKKIPDSQISYVPNLQHYLYLAFQVIALALFIIYNVWRGVL